MAETIIAPEYEGRVLIELLQNAHDAHPARATDGRIEIRLDEEEGEFGTLYVANRGKPFGGKNFKDLCSIALSSKRADAGIGHKGVGFKSVLHLCDAPEVYSVAREGSRLLDGFTFRFARLDDYDALAREVAPERAGFADYLRENLLTLKVPVFLEEAPKTVQGFARPGFVTVIRLPLKSTDARSAAGAQVRELMDDSIPFELFLDRLERVRLEWRAAGETRRRTYDRQVEVLHHARGLKVQQITLRRRMRLIVVCGEADPDRAREALAASIEKSGDATRLDGLGEEGRGADRRTGRRSPAGGAAVHLPADGRADPGPRARLCPRTVLRGDEPSFVQRGGAVERPAARHSG
ncbi:ATP-binding protein [Streptomyces sp. NPDC020800]|uniref:ATP-binding protein n=1 Tax=Streptomyces sp. NPDC020800 TaxID=3365092 RepID=UPI00379AC819